MDERTMIVTNSDTNSDRVSRKEQAKNFIDKDKVLSLCHLISIRIKQFKQKKTKMKVLRVQSGTKLNEIKKKHLKALKFRVLK